MEANITIRSLLVTVLSTSTYNIRARFCHPDDGISPNPTTQFLTHGIDFDKAYWDLPIHNGTNSFNVAVDEYNFCTLAMNWIGIADSHTPGMDPISLVQATANMSTIYAMTNMLGARSVPSTPVPFSKVVHVGHSFSSFLSDLPVMQQPSASDGLILTDFSFDGSWFSRTIAGRNLHLASLNQPLSFINVRPNPAPRTAADGLSSISAVVEIVQYLLNTLPPCRPLRHPTNPRPNPPPDPPQWQNTLGLTTGPTPTGPTFHLQNLPPPHFPPHQPRPHPDQHARLPPPTRPPSTPTQPCMPRR